MLLSTFELLLTKITPNPGKVKGSDRKVVQGYFLNLSNPTTTNSRIRLRFNATTPSLDPSKLLTALDTGGTNQFNGTLVAAGANRYQYDFTLGAGDTGLFILQPNIIELDPSKDELEVRGFVEIFILTSSPFTLQGVTKQLLVTPEHRGTFLPSPNNSQNDFDQLNVAIPTSTGAGLINVDFLSTFVLIPPDIPGFSLPETPPQISIPPAVEESSDINRENMQLQISLPQIISTIAQRMEAIEARLDSGPK